MGFAKDMAKFALSPAAALLGGKKKKPEVGKMIPTMISTTTADRPTSLLGPMRGGGGY